MTTAHSLDNLKRYHHEAMSFFGSQLAATLLLSAGQRKPTSMNNKF
jgi:hypothetical protein